GSTARSAPAWAVRPTRSRDGCARGTRWALRGPGDPRALPRPRQLLARLGPHPRPGRRGRGHEPRHRLAGADRAPPALHPPLLPPGPGRDPRVPPQGRGVGAGARLLRPRDSPPRPAPLPVVRRAAGTVEEPPPGPIGPGAVPAPLDRSRRGVKLEKQCRLPLAL